MPITTEDNVIISIYIFMKYKEILQISTNNHLCPLIIIATELYRFLLIFFLEYCLERVCNK